MIGTQTGTAATIAFGLTMTFAGVNTSELTRSKHQYSDSSSTICYKISEREETQITKEKGNVIMRIAPFRNLPKNWDGYGADPLLQENFRNAVSLIKGVSEESIASLSDYFPNPNGTLSMTWENEAEDATLSLEVGNKTFSYYVKNRGQKAQHYNNVSFTEANFIELEKNLKNLI